MKQWLIKGKIALVSITGDGKNILKVMSQIEEDTNKAYADANAHEEKWEDTLDFLQQGLMDEKKHKDWIDKSLKE